MFSKTFATNASVDTQDNTMCNGQKNITRVKEHQKIVNECFCDVVAYGYADEKVKLTKLKNVKSYAKLITDIKITLENTKRGHGSDVDGLLSDMLENTNIGSLRNIKIEPIWSDSCDCFMFMVRTIENLIDSEKLLSKLQNAEMSLMTADTIKRITDQQNEITSSNNYLQKVFLQFIHLMKLEIKKRQLCNSTQLVAIKLIISPNNLKP